MYSGDWVSKISIHGTDTTLTDLPSFSNSSLAPRASSTSDPDAIIIRSILSLLVASANMYPPLKASLEEPSSWGRFCLVSTIAVGVASDPIALAHAAAVSV